MEDEIIAKKKSSLLLKILKVTGALFLFVIIAGIAISSIFGNDIKQLVVREINKQLAVEVNVKGEIDFSVLRNFPFASVTFNKVEIKESYKGSKSNLLESEKISLLFNILDLWRGNYTIQKIIVGKGKLTIDINEKGEGNYFILKNGTKTSADELTVKIDKIELSDLETKFIDDEQQQFYEFQIHDGIINGEFGSEVLKLNLKSSLLCRHLFVSSDDYLLNKELKINTELNLNLKEEEYGFTNTTIEVENFSFSTSGKVKQKKYSTFIDLTFTGNQVGIESFAGILPEQYAKYLKEYNSNGTLVLQGRINGDYSAKKKPDISFAFSVKDATISNSAVDAKFEHVNFNALFSNGTARNLFSSKISLKNASAFINGKHINLKKIRPLKLSAYIVLQLRNIIMK
ncbi:MAG: hypothetical protein WCI97_11765 [Bacteroidota bacterium]